MTRTGGVGVPAVQVHADANGSLYDETQTSFDGSYSLSVAPGGYTLWFYEPSRTYGSGWYSTSGFTYARFGEHGHRQPDCGRAQARRDPAHVAPHKGSSHERGRDGAGGIRVLASVGAGPVLHRPRAMALTRSGSGRPPTPSGLRSGGDLWLRLVRRGRVHLRLRCRQSCAGHDDRRRREDVTLPAGMTISGRVTNGGATGLAGIRVSLKGADGLFSFTYTDQDAWLRGGGRRRWLPDLLLRPSLGLRAGRAWDSSGGFVTYEEDATPVVVSTGSVTGRDDGACRPWPPLERRPGWRASGTTNWQSSRGRSRPAMVALRSPATR